MNQLTKEYIQEVLTRKDNVGVHAVGRALVHLYNRQTTDEQNREATLENNSVGFTGVDGMIGASMAKFYKKRGYLTPKQVAYWQRSHGKSGATKIGKYWKQILEEAGKKTPSVGFKVKASPKAFARDMGNKAESDLANAKWAEHKNAFAKQEAGQEAQAFLNKLQG